MVHFVNPEMRDKTPAVKPRYQSKPMRPWRNATKTSVGVAAEVAESTEAKRYQWKDCSGTHPALSATG